MNEFETNWEPMDIDRSSSSASRMDISINDSATEDWFACDDIKSTRVTQESPPSPRLKTIETQYEDLGSMSEIQQDSIPNHHKTEIASRSNIKTYHIKKESFKRRSPPSFLKTIIVSLLVFILSAIMYQVINFECVDDLDLERIRDSYSKHIFGQPNAAKNIITALNENVTSKLIFLYGGTGVGKTYAISLIFENLWTFANIYHYTMPSFVDNFSPELMLGLTLCKRSIIVIDDLSRNDMHIAKLVENIIEKSTKIGKNVTVILVYNCDTVTENFVKRCDFSFQMDLKDSFENINADKYYIKFEQLTEEHLRKCIEKELGHRTVNKQEMDNILKNFNVSLDGCKGVYTKMKFMNMG